jgi:hypothetical protein
MTTELDTPPDRFEGEPDYVSDFWDKALRGLADSTEDGIFGFDITPEDSKKYPGLLVGQKLMLAESSDGFVYSKLIAIGS